MSSNKRPETSWTEFLSNAPYFTGAIMGAIDDGELSRYNERVRAVFYYDIFDGEVSNGGVMQYFFNQAFHLPEFDDAPRIVSKHPVLARALPFINEVHEAWGEVRDRVADARDSDEWPEELFSEDRFEDLETRFFAVHYAIRSGLYGAICASPEDYLSIRPEPRDKNYRFVDGFPVGPNVLDDSGREMVVWFSPDRQHVDVQRAGFFPQEGSYTRDWIDFRSGASGSRQFENHRLKVSQTQRHLWHRHGLNESYDDSGNVESTALALDDLELLRRFDDGRTSVKKSEFRRLLETSDDIEF